MIKLTLWGASYGSWDGFVPMDGSRCWRPLTTTILAHRCRQGAIHPISWRLLSRCRAAPAPATDVKEMAPARVLAEAVVGAVAPPVQRAGRVFGILVRK
jgi:hypothetical protein